MGRDLDIWYSKPPSMAVQSVDKIDLDVIREGLANCEYDWSEVETWDETPKKHKVLADITKWYQWLEAKLYNEPLPAFQLPDMRDKPIFIDHISMLNPPGGKALSYEAEQIYRMKYLTAMPQLSVNEMRAQFGLSAITA